MILKVRDSLVWIWLYLAQHQSFTGETRSWSRGIELGPRPRMEFHFTSDLHNQAYTEPKCLFPWLTWLHSLTSHLSPQSPDVLCQSVPSVISSSECRLRAAAWARISSGSYWQTGWKAAARCSHLATGLASVRPLIRCLLSPTRTLGCVQSPQRYHELGSRLQKCIHAVFREEARISLEMLKIVLTTPKKSKTQVCGAAKAQPHPKLIHHDHTINI